MGQYLETLPVDNQLMNELVNNLLNELKVIFKVYKLSAIC